MTTSQILLFVLALSAICSNLTHASAVQPHTPSPSPSPSPSMAPSPSPFHHHHHHHNHSHHNHTHHHHATSPSPAHSSVIPPTHSPAMPPALAPSPYSKPPTKAPSPSPHSSHTMPPRKLVAVEGVVYCKNCSYSGVDTLMGASPLPGAMVELRCRNTKYMIKKTSTTDKNGFFFLQAPKHITTYGAHKCLVFLLNNNNTSNGGTHNKCSNATNLNNGVSGGFLFLNKNKAPPSKPLPYSVYSVGPFAFEPPKCYKH